MNQASQRMFDFIVSYKREHDGNSPTIREIKTACQYASTSTVRYQLNLLAAAGLITLDFARHSKIQVAGGKWTMEA